MYELGLDHVHNMSASIEVPDKFSVYIGGACRMFKIKSMEDPEYQSLLEHFRSGEGKESLPDKTFYNVWNDVYVEDDLLFYDERLLVTKKLIPYVL